MGKETDIQREVIAYLKTRGFLVWRNHTQGIRLSGRRLKNPNAGQPDVWAVKLGQLLGIEVKTSTGRLQPEQVEWIEKAQQYGVPVIVVRSIPELEETLEEIWPRYFAGKALRTDFMILTPRTPQR